MKTGGFVTVGIALIFVALVAHRVWRYATYDARAMTVAMPQPVADEEERELYLSPGGSYTAADIAANDSTLPSQKFRTFQARHDYQPQPGERLCPVTRTKANRECTWIVAGQEYAFCCPPCIAEFVRLAKQRPAEIKPPGAYVQE